jgi:ADP-ribosyl-[dinitrogen reductase] hydrolase
LLGVIAGDIIGSRFEGHPAPPAGFELFHPRCRFTDDTVCSLAVASALLGNGDFAAELRRFVRRYPNAGYGGMFIGWAMRDEAPAYGSWGNGAPMRVAAVGWLAQSEAEVFALAKAQAAVSHDHPDAIAGAQAVALAIFLLRQGSAAGDVAARIGADFGYDLVPERALGGGGFDVSAKGTVPPALAAAFTAADFEAAVRTAVCLGGDTDTLACITGGIAEASFGVPPEIAAATRARLTPDLAAVLDRSRAAVDGARA